MVKGCMHVPKKQSVINSRTAKYIKMCAHGICNLEPRVSFHDISGMEFNNIVLFWAHGREFV